MNNIFDNYCVAFIDILGFQEMTKDSKKINEFAPLLNEAIDIMKNTTPKRDFINEQYKPKIISVQGADSMFFIFPKEFNDLLIVIYRLCFVQFMLASKGVYIRGSINSGSMYIDEKNEVYFGEAWNKAVTFEKSAVNPRIVLEDSIAKLVTDGLKAKNESVLEFYLDNDATYIISSYGFFPLLDFLDENTTEYDDVNDYFYEIYKDLFKTLASNIERYKDNRNVLQKYLWIVNEVERQNYKGIKARAGEMAKKIESLLSNF